jgi:hypothetical protein
LSSRSRAVLGIDAAWTATEPSGVALAIEGRGGRWRLVAVEACYWRFKEWAVGRGATRGLAATFRTRANGEAVPHGDAEGAISVPAGGVEAA